VAQVVSGTMAAMINVYIGHSTHETGTRTAEEELNSSYGMPLKDPLLDYTSTLAVLLEDYTDAPHCLSYRATLMPLIGPTPRTTYAPD
jgi:hypothetical protein